MASKSKPKKTWKEKLNYSKDLPSIKPITDKTNKLCGVGTVVIPAPLEVDELMKKVPKGKLITINEMRAYFAKKHSATIGCPITVGIFAWIAANAAAEDAAKGEKNITPYWRTLKSGGVINDKYPGGSEAQKKILEGEGHRIAARGKRYVVEDYAGKLVKL